MKTITIDSLTIDLKQITDCTYEVKDWMTSRMLKLNEDKTELLFLGRVKNVEKVKASISEVDIGSALIHPTNVVKDLGVYIDTDLSMDSQVNALCKTCYHHLRTIGTIRKFITAYSAHILVRSLVLSRLDYCNSLLFGLSKILLYKLQKVQNTAARIICLTSKRDHITPALKSLHWLPVRYRIDFKILCFVYKCLHNQAPEYLTDLTIAYIPTRTLRSQNQLLLKVPSARLASFGKRTFQYAAATLWNPLPTDIKLSTSLDTFKSHLKTHFFRLAYL